jgi:hypothetical protein
VLTLLTRVFSVSLAFLKVGILDYVTVNVAPPYQEALELRVFEPPRLFLVEWAVWYRQVVQSGPARSWYVRSYQALLPTGQT